jgi:hypothetical protein
MRCWWIFFHKWGKWSTPRSAKYIDTGSPYVTQERYCEKCNKWQQKVIDI